MASQLKPIAIHLPQFHPFAENDEWWGKGFTEWTNVAKARPLFEGHYQPHLPADLGFYDLRLEEARVAQAQLAMQYGIHGFCYYHYWFNGKRLLNVPVDAILKSGTPDFPFMLCWANENWTRRWDGQDQEVLMQQNYGLQDDVDHIRFLIDNVFKDPRYIKVNNKPFFLVYRPSLFPDVKQTLLSWRQEAAKAGIELFLGYMTAFGQNSDDLDAAGFDCAVDFQPNMWNLPINRQFSFKSRLKAKFGMADSYDYNNAIFSYPDYVDYAIASGAKVKDNLYPGISPSWDNSARRKKNAMIFKDSSPQEYGRWLKHITEKYKGKDTFLFINAWNEWAEGNHLEPDSKWGTQYLEITAKILKDA